MNRTKINKTSTVVIFDETEMEGELIILLEDGTIYECENWFDLIEYIFKGSIVSTEEENLLSDKQLKYFKAHEKAKIAEYRNIQIDNILNPNEVDLTEGEKDMIYKNHIINYTRSQIKEQINNMENEEIIRKNLGIECDYEIDKCSPKEFTEIINLWYDTLTSIIKLHRSKKDFVGMILFNLDVYDNKMEIDGYDWNDICLYTNMALHIKYGDEIDDFYAADDYFGEHNKKEIEVLKELNK